MELPLEILLIPLWLILINEYDYDDDDDDDDDDGVCNRVCWLSKYITDKLQYVLYSMLQRVSSLAHAISTTACHTCCMRSCTGSTSQKVSSTSWESQSIVVCSTRLLSTWSSGRLLYTRVRHSQQTSFTAATRYHLTVYTTLPAEHFRSSGLLCCRSDSLKLATGQSP